MVSAWNLQGKTVLVTGASSGIGWETALAFAQRGAKIGLAARRAERLSTLAKRIRAKGGEALELTCDVTKPEDVKRAVARMRKEWGRIDVLVNNAGANEYVRFLELEPEESEALIRTNLLGPMRLLHEVLPVMKTQGSGHVVNVASLAGLRGIPYMAPYCASKFGLVGLTESLRVELRGSGITLTAFCPGTVHTAMADKLLDRDKDAARGVRGKTPQAVAQRIVRATERRWVQDVFGEAPGWVLVLARLIPGTTDALLAWGYGRMKSLFPHRRPSKR